MMTIVAVLSPTIGATFSVCAWRVGGTLIGILWAMLTCLAYPKNPFVILVMMPFISKYNVLERFIDYEAKQSMLKAIYY